MSLFQREEENDKPKECVFEAVLAKEMKSLSIEEREDVYETIHGVDQDPTESDEMIAQRLEGLSIAIDRIPEKAAYDMAVNKSTSCKEYMLSRKFRLMFLHSENFHVTKAAIRLVSYMDQLLDHFGHGVLGRPLYFSDLCDDAKHCLKLGVYQVWHNARDSAGRGLIYINYSYGKKLQISTKGLVQTFFYLFYSAVVNDELSQKRGLVIVCTRRDSPKTTGRDGERQRSERRRRFGPWAMVLDLTDCLPVKNKAIHICFVCESNSLTHIWAPLTWALMNQSQKRLVRIHDGTHLECCYKLQSFGIPVDSIPVDYAGNPITTSSDEWIIGLMVRENAMKYVEEQANNEEEPESEKPVPVADTRIIDNPEKDDVALWRGRVYQLHPGNVRMRNLIDQYRQEYDNAKRFGKAEIAMKIVSIIQTNHGGRFLTKNACGWWQGVSDEEAQKRVSKAFRSARATVAKYKSNKEAKLLLTGEEEESNKDVDYVLQTTGDGNGKKRVRVESPSMPMESFCGDNWFAFGGGGSKTTF